MKKVNNNELEEIVGGMNITGQLINSFANILRTIKDIGAEFGSTIRRISEGNMCRLD